jgi:hypothetical protein
MSPDTATKTEPLFYSIHDAAHALAISPWSVKDLLKRQVLRARKAGRRTLVEGQSVREYAAGLPQAKFQPPPARRAPAKGAAACNEVA